MRREWPAAAAAALIPAPADGYPHYILAVYSTSGYWTLDRYSLMADEAAIVQSSPAVYSVCG